MTRINGIPRERQITARDKGKRTDLGSIPSISTYRSKCQCPPLPFSVRLNACISPRPIYSSHGLQDVSADIGPRMTPFAKSASLLDSFNAQYQIPRLRCHQSPMAPPRPGCCPNPNPDSPGPPRGRPWSPRPTSTT